MSYTLDSIVTLINRKEPLPRPFLKDLNSVKSSAHHLGIYKIAFHELCSKLNLDLTHEHYNKVSFVVNCDFLYKLVSVLLRHEVAMVPMGVPCNLSIYHQIYLTSRADILSDSDIYQLQTIRSQQKTKYTNNEIEIIQRAKKKIENFNTLLHLFEIIGCAKTTPLDASQRAVLSSVIEQMLLPREAERYIRFLFSYASELGSFQYDFTNPKYVSVANCAWGEQSVYETVDLLARVISPSHCAINIPDNFPHAKLLKERYHHYSPVIFDNVKEEEEKNIIPVARRLLCDLPRTQRYSRLIRDIDELLAQYHKTRDRNAIMELCGQSKNEILQSRNGFSSDFIRRIATLPKEYGNLTAYIDKLQNKLMSDEDARICLPNFDKTKLVVYTKDNNDSVVTSRSITNSLLNCYCNAGNLAHDGDPKVLLDSKHQALSDNSDKVDEGAESFDNTSVQIDIMPLSSYKRSSYIKATESALKYSLSNLEMPSAKNNNTRHEFIPVDRKVVKSGLVDAYSRSYNEIDYNTFPRSAEGKNRSLVDKQNSIYFIDPTDFKSTEIKNAQEIIASAYASGLIEDDNFHIGPYTCDRFNFLLHNYLIWEEDEKQVLNEPSKVIPSIIQDYGSNLEQFIKSPISKISRFNRLLNFEFILRRFFSSPTNSSSLNDQTYSDDHDVELLFDLVSSNYNYLKSVNKLPLIIYHSLYYFDRYLQNPQIHFNNELFYVAIFKKEPCALNLYLSRIFQKYGARLIDIPEQFYIFFAFNLILFPEKECASICQTIAKELFNLGDASGNLYKVVLLRTIAHQLYDLVHNNHKDTLYMSMISSDEILYKANWSHYSSHMFKSQKLFESLLPEQYFTDVCSKELFSHCLDHVLDSMGYFEESVFKNSEPIIGLLNSYQEKSIDNINQTLFTLFDTMDRVLSFIDDLDHKVQKYLKDHPKVQETHSDELDKQKLKEDLQNLEVDTQTPIFKPARRQIKDHNSNEPQFESKDQEREDIFNDYAQRFSHEGKNIKLDDDLDNENYVPRWQQANLAQDSNPKVKSLSASDVVAKLMALKQNKQESHGQKDATFDSKSHALGSDNTANKSNANEHNTKAPIPTIINFKKVKKENIHEEFDYKQEQKKANSVLDDQLMALFNDEINAFKQLKVNLASVSLDAINSALNLLTNKDHIKGVNDYFDQILKSIEILIRKFQENEGQDLALIIDQYGEAEYKELVLKLNILFMHYASLSFARVFAHAQGYGSIIDKTPLHMQNLNLFFHVNYIRSSGYTSTFSDNCLQHLLSKYVSPLVQKLIGTRHDYFYAFNRGIDLKERFERIANHVQNRYLKGFSFKGLAYNRFIVDCASAKGDEVLFNKVHSFALKVNHAKQIGFPQGIATDRLYEVSEIVNDTLGLQIVPYFIHNSREQKITYLRKVVTDIKFIPIPELYNFKAAALRKDDSLKPKKEAYENLLFSLYCAHVVLEILHAVMLINNKDGLIKLLCAEILAMHKETFNTALHSFIFSYLSESINFINKQGAIEQKLLINKQKSLDTILFGYRGKQRFKRLVTVAFGYLLKQSFVGNVAKKQFAIIMKNINIFDEKELNNTKADNLEIVSAKDSSSYDDIDENNFNQGRVRNQRLDLDLEKIKAKIKESEHVQEVITKLRDEEQKLQEQELYNTLNLVSSSDSNDQSFNNSDSESLDSQSSNSNVKLTSSNDSNSTLMSDNNEDNNNNKLDDKLCNVIDSLVVQSTDAMVYNEFNGICVSHGLISGNYCIEVLNEYCFEEYDEPLLEMDGEGNDAIVYICTDLLEQIHEKHHG